MSPIEVKCHSFITAIAEPPYIDNEPPKMHNGFLLVCNKAATFVWQNNTIFVRKFAWTKTLVRSEKKLLCLCRPTWPPWRQQFHFEDARKAGSEWCRIALPDFLENIVTSFPYRVFSQRWPLVFQNNELRAMLMFQTNPVVVNSLLMQRFSIVPKRLHRCRPREWKRSIVVY